MAKRKAEDVLVELKALTMRKGSLQQEFNALSKQQEKLEKELDMITRKHEAKLKAELEKTENS